MPGSLLFKKTTESVPNLYDFSQWWKWSIRQIGKNLKEKAVILLVKKTIQLFMCHMRMQLHIVIGQEKDYQLKLNGNMQHEEVKNKIYFWGNLSNSLHQYVNSWEGEFPVENIIKDGFEKSAPVKSFPQIIMDCMKFQEMFGSGQ